ncbi:hypothetical protein EG329_011301 [Mollisiaceae sp. DMI_Dod_QoI]|nr:hypothetical protein EG329_011301 [Helotiales sp. DMI_Dod_QoI]
MPPFIAYDPLGPKPRAKIPDQEWEKHHEVLKSLYGSSKLERIMEIMKNEHGFNASARQYKQKFSNWRFAKNISKRDMKVIARKEGGRRARGKFESKIMCRGQEVSQKKLKRFRQDNANAEDILSPLAATPPYISVATPSECSPFSPGKDLMDEDFVDADVPEVNRPLNEQGFALMKQKMVHYAESMDHLHEPGGFSNTMHFSRSLGLEAFLDKIMILITGFLDFDDVVALGLTCKALYSLLKDEKVCELFLNNTIPQSKEALQARTRGRGYASAFWRVARRRLARRLGNPFAIINIGIAGSFLYCEGVVSYIVDDKIRILDLHNSASSEIVVSILDLMKQALSLTGGEIVPDDPIILYYSKSILSLFWAPISWDLVGYHGSWLIVINVETKQILATIHLGSTESIFARHNERYLYYGAKSARNWRISGFDLSTGASFGDEIEFSCRSSSEIGLNTCFETFNGYFYAVLSDSRWFSSDHNVSTYNCMRFPLDRPFEQSLEKTEFQSVFRRIPPPIPRVQRSLSLQKDDHWAYPKIIETRSRDNSVYWLNDNLFPIRFEDTPSGFNMPLSTALTRSPNSVRLITKGSEQCNSTSLGTVSKVQPSSPDALSGKIHVRYHSGAPSTFLGIASEMFLHSFEDHLTNSQWAQIKASTVPSIHPRDLRRLLSPKSAAINRPVRKISVDLWPPTNSTMHCDPDHDTPYGLLNSSSYFHCDIRFAVDERSILYQSYCRYGSIVFISFDPAIKLAGLKQWKPQRRSASAGESDLNQEEAAYISCFSDIIYT